MVRLWMDEMANDDFLETLALLDSSDEETERKHGGSLPFRAPNLDRGREDAAQRLHDNYFSATPVYNATQFKRRFRITRSIYGRIASVLEVHDPYLTQRTDCTERKALTSEHKLTAALRLLAYVSAADSVDEYVRIGEFTAVKCSERFREEIGLCIGEEYLRAPTKEIGFLFSDLGRIFKRFYQDQRRGGFLE